MINSSTLNHLATLAENSIHVVKQQMKKNAGTTNSTTKDLFTQAVGSLTSSEVKTKVDRQEASLHKMVRRAQAQFNCNPTSPSSLEDPHATLHPHLRW